MGNEREFEILMAEARALGMARLDAGGAEVLDPRPMAPPVGYKREPSLMEKVRAMVRSEQFRMAAEAAGAETFEEADDFEVGDDYDPTSPYEEVFEPAPRPDPIPAGSASPNAPTASEASGAPSQAGSAP